MRAIFLILISGCSTSSHHSLREDLFRVMEQVVYSDRSVGIELEGLKIDDSSITAETAQIILGPPKEKGFSRASTDQR